ncbi:MAG: hypothetical protein N4A68_15120 [Maledivibacter sp.]|jgi:hypothetical protein|nr:hypothetical protein [Maledivibacter sp.]
MNKKEWNNRIANRSDFTAGLVHLTKSNKDKNKSSLEILMKILKEQNLIGSTINSGYIVVDIPAVCLQDTLLYLLANC